MAPTPERAWCDAMRLLVINPNTTASMTHKIEAAAKAAAYGGTTLTAVNPADGPASIEGYFDEAYCIPGLLGEIRKGEEAGFQGYVIACFDDTGLDAARSIAAGPVIGIGEAAFHCASLIADRFSVITTLSRSVPAIEHNLGRYGLAARCARVRASDVAVLALEDGTSNARVRISDEIEAAKREDRSEAIVLGCAGMADLAADLSAQHGLPVLDGVACAVKLLEGLVSLGLKTSKLGGYAHPLPKNFTGRFAADGLNDTRTQ
jgi:allantoin racemase